MKSATYEAYRNDLENCLGGSILGADRRDTNAGLHFLLSYAGEATGERLLDYEPTTAMGRLALASAEINDATGKLIKDGQCWEVEPRTLRAVDRLLDPPSPEDVRLGLIVVGGDGLPVAMRKTDGYDYLFTLRPTSALIPGVIVPAGFMFDVNSKCSWNREEEMWGDQYVSKLPGAQGRDYVKVIHLGDMARSQETDTSIPSVRSWELALVRPTVFALDDEVIGYDRPDKEATFDDLPLAIEPGMMSIIRARVDAVYRGEAVNEHFGKEGRS